MSNFRFGKGECEQMADIVWGFNFEIKTTNHLLFLGSILRVWGKVANKDYFFNYISLWNCVLSAKYRSKWDVGLVWLQMSPIRSLQFSVSNVIKSGSLLPFSDVEILKSYKFGCVQYLCAEKKNSSLAVLNNWSTMYISLWLV